MLRDILDGDAQVAAVVSVLRAAKADILVLGGIDYDLQGHALGALGAAVGGYPHQFALAPNRGVASGFDADGDGRLGEPEDAQGHGGFAGQGGLAILSKLPIDAGGVQDFSGMPWHNLPGSLAGDDIPNMQRLSTTAHWSVPVGPVALMVWHATPPVFDGPEDRNGRRNHDEAAIWQKVLDGEVGVRPDAPVVLAGLANLDISDGDGRPGALAALLSHPDLADPLPESAGGAEAAMRDGGANLGHSGDPALDTVDWSDEAGRPGNLRVDYILTDRRLRIIDAGVLWPMPGDSLGGDVSRASRHRLVWVDVEVQR